MDRFDNYYKLLRSLTPGSRHVNLCKVIMSGLRCDMSDVQILHDIIDHGLYTGNNADLNEIRSAMGWCHEKLNVNASLPWIQTSFRRQPPSVPTMPQAQFFESMLQEGRAWRSAKNFTGLRGGSEALYALSTVRFDKKDKHDQALSFLTSLFPDDDDLVFAGEPFSPRDRAHIFRVGDLQRNLLDPHFQIPRVIMTNSVDGSSSPVRSKHGDHESFATKAQINHPRNALIEFDGFSEYQPDGQTIHHPLLLSDQADFWIGCIIKETLPVRTLTFSGSKSIHGIIALDESKSWDNQWKDIGLLLDSSPNRLFHCDMACKDTTRLTRFAGHLRTDFKAPHHPVYQKLLYAAKQPSQTGA